MPIARGDALDIRAAGQVNRGTSAQPLPMGGSQGPPARPVLLPPTFFPYQGSRRVFSQLSATVSAITPSVVATIVLLPSEIAVISDIEIGLNAMLATTLAAWTVRFNGGPIEWGPLSLIPRPAVYAGSAWSQLGVRVPIGVAVIDILATIADPGTYLMGASITGWAWPLALEDAIREGRAG